MKFSNKKKLRLDEFLVEKEYFENVDTAKRNIMAGNVIINNVKLLKAGEMISLNKVKEVKIKSKGIPYVSRGGLKLEKAIKEFDIDFKDKIVLDIGASTGGFTDCALQNGAKFVYAVDVGTNQLDWKLRTNQNIKSIENRHINDLEKEEIDNKIPDIIVMDISFISIKKVFSGIQKFMNEDTVAIFLIKPQFEAQKENIDKGIVKDTEIHKEIIADIKNYVETFNVNMLSVVESPIRGTKGNIEYLALLKK
ncbi:MAG: TlyA family rRNA (cytidine-2'-O)-methyltransferase [Fusobacteriales bacterium]|nr:MAG: TlyA family rRNA (cytidine-2'-O)-methyltransferase [Fusobacteriales bacterium]